MKNENDLLRLELQKLLQDKENLDYEKIKAILSKTSASRQEMFIQRLKQREEISKILTPEQQEALKAFTKDRMIVNHKKFVLIAHFTVLCSRFYEVSVSPLTSAATCSRSARQMQSLRKRTGNSGPPARRFKIHYGKICAGNLGPVTHDPEPHSSGRKLARDTDAIVHDLY